MFKLHHHPVILFVILAVIFFSAETIASTNSFKAANTGSSSEQFLPVDQAYRSDILTSKTENADHTIAVLWQIQPGYFLYRHGFAVEWFSGQSINQYDKDQLNLMNGIKKDDPYFGPVEIFYHSVAINLPIPLTDKAIYLKATSQGCADAGLCYPPYSVFFRIKPDGTVTPIDKQQYLKKKQRLHPSEENSHAIIEKPARATLVTILAILFAAFIGGLILNLMPCVLPILALKVFQLTKQQDKKQRQLQGIAYLFGVISSFLLVAFVMITLKSAGNQIGWGFQLQNPWFIVLLVYLFFILGLSLSGFLQIGARFMNTGQSLTEKRGTKGSFFTGVLAVVVASPCTAPFMGTALGFASTQPAWIALLIFAMLGLGMAIPLTLISLIPATAKWLPKPGAWMERLKEFFAFPLYLTAIWLLWVLGKQTGINAMTIATAGCLLIAFGIWLLQRKAIIGNSLAIAALLLALLIIPLPGLLHNLDKNPQHLVFTQKKLDQMRQEGKAVLLDVTADWCITCKTNEATTLNTHAVQNALKDADIAYMVADWTNSNPEITALLSRHGRNGIPLYLLYPANAHEPAIILPQLLTKSTVINAIHSMVADDKSRQNKSNVEVSTY